MLIELSTLLSVKYVRKVGGLIASCLLLIHFATAQVVTVPASNPNDSSTRKPFGSYYGYERTQMLFTAADIGQSGNITKVGFYLNSIDNPGASTPVVIRMKTTTASSITAAIYGNAISGATQVFSGNVTSSTLTAGNWVTVNLNTPFNYSSNNLVIFVETNYGDYGNENFDAKQFRHSSTTSARCQFWEDDIAAPIDNGVLSLQRPNIQITFEANCSGTPNPGNTISTANAVCAGESFTLSLQNTPTTPGLTYVWQSSTGSSYTNIPGGTSSTLTLSQTVATSYRCSVTCTIGGASATSTALQVNLNPFYHCYCPSAASDISDSKIDAFSMANISTSSSPGECESYTDYTTTPGIVAAGQQVTIHVSNGSCSGFFYPSYVGVYIDYDQNGVFNESNERVYAYGPTTDFNSIPDYTFIIPTAAPDGITGMRVIVKEGDSIPDPCIEYTYGETEDYLLDISGAVACSSPPTPGATISSEASVCANEPFNLSLTNYQSNTGITYQWKYSTDNSTYINIPAATSPLLAESQTVATWYRCDVTCVNSGGGTTQSIPVKVDMNPFYVCYCASYATNTQSADTKIDSVKLITLVTGSAPDECETYTDYTALTVDIPKVNPITIQIDHGACTGQFYESYVAVYIDYGGDGVYDASDLVYSYGPDTALHSIPDGIFTVNPLADLGKTGMRIVLSEGEAVPSACGTYEWGETEDYVVNIVDLPPCISPPDAGVASVSAQSFCTADVPAEITLSLADYTAGIGQTYQWESSPDGSDWDPLPSQTNPDAAATVTGTTWYRCKVTCSGNFAYSEVAMVEVKAIPAGNTQSDPIVISDLPYTHTGNNLSSGCWTSNYENFTQQPSPDVYYQLSLVDTSGTLEISTCIPATGDLDTYLHLINDAGVHLFSNDNNGPLCTGGSLGDYASIKFYVGDVPANLFIVVEGHAFEEGTYTLNVNFIPDSITQVIDIPSSDESDFTIYPNPSNGNVTIQVNLGNDVTKVATLNLFNTIGQLVQTQQISLVQGKYIGDIQISDALADGVYRLQLNNGETVLSKPIIVQH